MPTFALRKIEAVRGQQQFEKLVVDGDCPFDDFEDGLEEQYRGEMAGIYNHMEDVANHKILPRNKFHFYDNDKKKKRKDGVREFEFKSKHLRVYGITKPGGKIVITGGTKAKQKADQAEFRRLKNLYLASIISETTTKIK